ncbi:glycosyl transferase family 90 [Paracoccus sp. Ld10]|uniref:glycosyl transferase family 90 n=1 Tax=Paracoccus sp. Ld10 TaxID=649158 RepID=UPI00386E26FC
MGRAVVIHVGPDGPIDAALARMFQANGHRAVCHDGGRLAADIVYAMGQGIQPLRGWPNARLIAGLFRDRPHWRPTLQAWRCVAFLRDHMPDALFLLTIPPPDRWPDGMQAHLDATRALFGDDPQLIELDLAGTTPADLAARLRPVLPLDQGLPDRWPDPDPVTPPPPAPPAPPGWAQDVAGFCLAGLNPTAQGGPQGLSGFATHWDGTLSGTGAVTDVAGAPRQFTIVAPPGHRPLTLARDGRPFKLIRAEGVINDILALDRRDPVWIDMEDSRWFGSPQGAALDRPILCHNRRAGAVNPVLWPLPDQHAIGLQGFDPAAPADDIPWDEKQDRLVWRGMISGSEMRDGVKPGPASHVWLGRLAAAVTPADRDAAWQGLCRTNRMAFVRRFQDHPDFDVGIVMAHGFRQHADDPLIAPYCRPRMGLRDFRAYRYQLCLSGYDHGSNFISGLDQNGVLLAEDDGWQVFYTGRFRPWRHFIPVARHLTDLEDKLAWARAHPDACRTMSSAARAEAAHLRDPAARADLMRLILDGLAAAR